MQIFCASCRSQSIVICIFKWRHTDLISALKNLADASITFEFQVLKNQAQWMSNEQDFFTWMVIGATQFQPHYKLQIHVLRENPIKRLNTLNDTIQGPLLRNVAPAVYNIFVFYAIFSNLQSTFRFVPDDKHQIHNILFDNLNIPLNNNSLSQPLLQRPNHSETQDISVIIDQNDIRILDTIKLRVYVYSELDWFASFAF